MIRSDFIKNICVAIFIIFFSFLDFTHADKGELQVEQNLYYQPEIKPDYSQETYKIFEPKQNPQLQLDNKSNHKDSTFGFSNETKNEEEVQPWKDSKFPFISREIYYMQLKEKSKLDDADAKAQLGMLYVDGLIIENDPEKVSVWLTNAAARGNYKAQYSLGEMYSAGHGVTQDYTKATNLFEQAAKQGDAFAQYNLAMMVENGIGIERDTKKAIYWYAMSNFITGNNDTKNLEFYAKTVGENNIEPILILANESASNTSNLRNVSTKEIYEAGEKFSDNLFKNAPLGYMGFLYPKVIKYEEHGSTRLIFSKSRNDIISECSNDENQKILENIKMHRTMGANLRSAAFQIELNDKEIQDKNPDKEMLVWNWNIMPRKAGLQNFDVQSRIVVKVQGKVFKSYSSPFKPMRIPVEVEGLSTSEKLKRWAKKNITSIIVGSIVAIIGVIMGCLIQSHIQKKHFPKQKL